MTCKLNSLHVKAFYYLIFANYVLQLKTFKTHLKYDTVMVE